jgi:mono/diheme cytochrome c family protein
MGFFRSTLIMLALVAAAISGTIYFGLVEPGADKPHADWVHGLIEVSRDRAIAVRAEGLDVPVLGLEAQVLNGAGNYAAMCTGCHLAPGMAPTELSRGLYPAAPALAELGAPDPARAFWVIKHGVKASGMPAWGGSMPDEYIWNMVAFLQAMPNMDADRYRALVAASGGHSHGGGEAMPHGHEETGEQSHDQESDAPDHHADGSGEATQTEDASDPPPADPASKHDHSTHDH